MHYRSDATGHHGDAPWEHIRTWVDRGDLSPDTMVSRDGTAWVPVGEFDPEAFPDVPPPPHPATTAPRKQEAPFPPVPRETVWNRNRGCGDLLLLAIAVPSLLFLLLGIFGWLTELLAKVKDWLW